jgi:flagellum-specific ATP synthase
VSDAWLGRVVDALGRPLDGKGAIPVGFPQPLWPVRTSPLERGVVRDALPTGVRAIDSMLTVGKGQRMGIFAGPGVGKSTLLGSIARGTSAHVNVIGLIGERGREVPEFIEHVLGEEGLRRSVVVVATGDESPLMRVRAASVACSAAEFFRDQGLDVLLMLDSITRFAQAQRQIGLSAGEAPATKGYTPSVFSQLPRLLERAGAIQGGGSITGFYTVLVEGDDMTEPVADAARGILDGHIVLSRKLAERVHFPAIDVLGSISRVADQVSDQNHLNARRHVSRLLAAYREAEELIQIGAYAKGSNPDVDAAIAMRPSIDAFLKQGAHERNEYPRTLRSLIELSLAAEGAGRKPNQPQAAAPRKN